MRRPLVLAAGLLLVLPALAAASSSEIPIDHLSLPVPSGKAVHLQFPVGELRVEASTSSKIELELTGRCKGWGHDDCEDRARHIRVETDASDGRLDLDVKGYPNFPAGDFHLYGVLRVPANVDLELKMGVGDLRVADVEGDLSVDLGVGDAQIRTASRSIRSADVQAGVGDAAVIAGGSRVPRRGFIGSTASWDEGRGRSSVTLHVGVGDATVRID